MRPLRRLFRVLRRSSPALGAQLLRALNPWNDDLALRVVDAFVARDSVVVDIGAHWGAYTCRLLRLVGPGGHVHAVEPNPTEAPSLERLARRHPNLTFHRVALSNRSGRAELHVPVIGGEPHSATSTLSPPRSRSHLAHARVAVQLARLDDILPVDVPISFIKCDVEGHELAVLEGADRTLRRWHPSLLVEIEQRHQDADIHETFRHLAGLGYVGLSIHFDSLRPLAEFDVLRDQLSLLGDGLFAPRKPSREYVNDFLFVPPHADVSSLPLRRSY